MDYDKLAKAIQYAKSLSPTIFGTGGEELLEGYPDRSDNSVLQWLFDTLNPIELDNEWCFNDVQSILDKWLLEELTPLQAREQIKEVWYDYFDFGC